MIGFRKGLNYWTLDKKVLLNKSLQGRTHTTIGVDAI